MTVTQCGVTYGKRTGCWPKCGVWRRYVSYWYSTGSIKRGCGGVSADISQLASDSSGVTMTSSVMSGGKRDALIAALHYLPMRDISYALPYVRRLAFW